MAVRVVEVNQGTNYWKVTIRGDWKEIDEASNWCLSHECGKRISVSQFGFRTEAELTMFRLRWETEFSNGG